MLDLETFSSAVPGWANGKILTLDDLPPRYNRRWSAEQKRMLLSAIDGGLLSASGAAARYALAPEEIAGWRNESLPQAEAAAAPSAAPTVDQFSRLIAILVSKGVLDEWDVASLSVTPEAAMTARISAFLVDDRPIC